MMAPIQLISFRMPATENKLIKKSEKVIALLRSPERRRDYVACLRYRVTRDAVQFTVKTLKELPDEPPQDRGRLVFFAHFDPDNQVDEYVRFYIEKLYSLGSTIIFVSGSPDLREESAAKVAPYCAAIYTRRTLSLDFGSWHLAWQQMKRKHWRLENFEQLLFANDSVYGPLFDLNEMFAELYGADMYGVTESKEQQPHLQSYFLLWDLNPRTRAFIEEFWKNFRYVVRKETLIKRCEIGISQQAREWGLQQKAFISNAAARHAAASYEDHEHVAELRTGDVNNTLYLWDVLIAQFRCPFLKADLPRRNRYGSAKILELSSFLREWTEYDPALIEGNLKRIGATPNRPRATDSG